MKIFLLLPTLAILLFTKANAQDSLQTIKPDTIQQAIALVNTTPVSDVDIPIIIGLKPFYKWANSYIDTLYTSPNYPTDWVQDACDSRYQYRFLRGPFKFLTYNNFLVINFLGYYQVKGSTRICSNGASLSPWTPSCGCGFGSEKPRRIDAGFLIKFGINADYSLQLMVEQVQPIAVDKCEVCFFGKDITKTIVTQFKSDLDTSIADMQRKMKAFSLKPYIQQLWDTLQLGYKLPGIGYLNFNPEQFRIGQLTLLRDTLYGSLGLSARPSLDKEAPKIRLPLPNISEGAIKNGFKIFTQLHLPYDSLNSLLNKQMAGNEMQVGKGLFKKTIRIDSIKLLGGGTKMFVQVFLSKGVRGTVFLEGKPNWDGVTGELKMDSLNFYIKSKQLLIRTAGWLMDGAIEKKIKEACKFQLAGRLKSIQYTATLKMNQQLSGGISSKGYLNNMQVNSIVTNPTGIDIGATASGRLLIEVDGEALLKQFVK